MFVKFFENLFNHKQDSKKYPNITLKNCKVSKKKELLGVLVALVTSCPEDTVNSWSY